jgi:HK97 family phage portal protein
MPWLGESKSSAPEAPKTKIWRGSANARKPYTDYHMDWDPTRVLEDALKKVTWVYRCVDAIASNAARQPIVFRKDNPWVGEEVEIPELKKVLNKKANPGEDSFMFRYRLSAQVLTSRHGAFVEIIRDRAGRVAELRLFPPDQVKPLPDSNKFVSGYEVRVLDAEGRPSVKKLKPENIIWIRKPNPFNPYMALTPLESAGVSVETDWFAKMYNRNFLLNDGRPGGMIVLKGDVTDDDMEELQSRFRGSIAMAGRVTVIAAEAGADFVDTAINPRDAQYIEGRKNTKEEILMAFGVPEPVIGNAAGRTFDNAEMERLIFWMETMMPHLELIMRPLDDALDDQEDVYVSYDLSMVDVLQRMEMKRKEYNLREWDGGVITLDEYRAATGREPIGDDLGRLMVLATTKEPYLTIDGEELELPLIKKAIDPDAPVPPGMGDGGNNPNGRTPDGDVEEEPEEEAPDREDERPAPLENEPQKSTAGELEAQIKYLESLEIKEQDEAETRTKEIKAAINEEIDSVTEQISSVAARFLERQKRVVTQKLGGRKMRAFTEKREQYIKKHGPVTNEAPYHVSLKAAVETVYDQETWDQQLSEDVEPILEAAIERNGRKVADELGVEFDPESVVVKAALATQLARVLKVNDATRHKVEEVLTTGALSNADAAEMTEMLSDEFDDMIDSRPGAIGLTEAVAAVNAGRYLGGLNATDKQKVWLALDDPKVRLTHSDADMQQVSVGDYFEVGGAKMLYPGDPSGPAAEVVNCRCSVGYAAA